MESFPEEITRLRRGELVKGVIGFLRIKQTFTIEEVRERHSTNQSVPLDLMPREFWSPPELPFPLFGEEALGREF